MNPELESLRKRVKNQRRDLRRLNQLYTSLLIGYRNGVRAQSLYGFRQRMEQAFGCEAVWRAERGLAVPTVPQGVLDAIRESATAIFGPQPPKLSCFNLVAHAQDVREVSSNSYPDALWLLLRKDLNGDWASFTPGPAECVDGVNAVQDASGRQFVRIPKPELFSWATASASSTHAPTPAGAGPGTPHSPGSSPSTSPRPESEPDTSPNPST